MHAAIALALSAPEALATARDLPGARGPVDRYSSFRRGRKTSPPRAQTHGSYRVVLDDGTWQIFRCRQTVKYPANGSCP